MSYNYSQTPRGPKSSSSSSAYHRTGGAPPASSALPHPPNPPHSVGYNNAQHAPPKTVQTVTSNVTRCNDSEGPNLRRLNQAVQCVESIWKRRPVIQWNYDLIRDRNNIIYHRAKCVVDGEDCEWSEAIWRTQNAAKEAAAPYATQKVIQRYNVTPYPNSLGRF